MDAARGGSRGCAMDGSGTGAECAVRSGGPPSSGAEVADSGRALGAELATCLLGMRLMSDTERAGASAAQRHVPERAWPH